MKVSFDFDGCLAENPALQKLASVLVKNDEVEVFVLTSRDSSVANRDLLALCDRLGIPHASIVYTPNAYKWHKVVQHSIDMHFDDDFNEIEMINTLVDDSSYLKPGMLVAFYWNEREAQKPFIEKTLSVETQAMNNDTEMDLLIAYVEMAREAGYTRVHDNWGHRAWDDYSINDFLIKFRKRTQLDEEDLPF